MKKLWKMKKDAVSPVIATILMVAITVVLAAVLYVMVMGFGGGGGQETPTITMNYQKDSTGNYTFTVVGVTANDVAWDDITFVWSPEDGSANWDLQSSDTDYVGAGDTVLLADPVAGTTYTLTLKYAPTGGAVYSYNLYVAA